MRYVFYMYKCKKNFCQDNKISTLILYNTLYNTARNILPVLCMFLSKMSCFEPRGSTVATRG